MTTVALRIPVAVTATATAAEDARVKNAEPQFAQFIFLTAQLVVLVWAMRAFQIEERAFLTVMGVATGAFAVHYWLPFRLKEPFWIVASLAGGALLVGPVPLVALVFVGLVFYGLLASGLSYRLKLAIMAVLAVLLMVGRALEVQALPASLWPVLGALFMFRMVVYLYDLPQTKGRPSLQEFFAYFFPLPNFYFLLFPVIDLQTQRRTFFQRDIHDIAQQGLLWMARGAMQLLHGAQGQVPWTELAEQCGFYDQAHLSNEFRRFTGLSPTELARRDRPDSGSIVLR